MVGCILQKLWLFFLFFLLVYLTKKIKKKKSFATPPQFQVLKICRKVDTNIKNQKTKGHNLETWRCVPTKKVYSPLSHCCPHKFYTTCLMHSWDVLYLSQVQWLEVQSALQACHSPPHNIVAWTWKTWPCTSTQFFFIHSSMKHNPLIWSDRIYVNTCSNTRSLLN